MSTTKLFSSDQLNSEPWLDMTCYPTIPNIVSLKRFLSYILPNELIDMILDLAEYWPHSSSSSPSPIKAQGRVQESVLQGFPAYWRECRGSQTTHPPSFTNLSEDGFVVSSPPLGLPPTNVVQSFTSLVPRTRHPVRMIIFEIRYYRLFALNRKCRRPQIVRQSSTRLEVGIKRPTPPIESSPKVIMEPAVWLTARYIESSPRLQQICDRVYRSWQSKRSFCDPAHIKIDLYMNHKALAENMIGQKTVIWRYDDNGNYLDDRWDISRGTLKFISETEKAHVNEFVHALAQEDRRDQADFVKQLEVGDSLGVWVRVRDGPSVSMIEGVRVHVFWAAS